LKADKQRKYRLINYQRRLIDKRNCRRRFECFVDLSKAAQRPRRMHRVKRDKLHNPEIERAHVCVCVCVCVSSSVSLLESQRLSFRAICGTRIRENSIAFYVVLRATHVIVNHPQSECRRFHTGLLCYYLLTLSFLSPSRSCSLPGFLC
jgi:hypothetical protein